MSVLLSYMAKAIPLRVIALLILSAALSYEAWRLYSNIATTNYLRGAADVQAEWSKANAAADLAARDAENKRKVAMEAAQNDRLKQISVAQRDAASARSELEQLRAALQTTGRSDNASSQSGSPTVDRAAATGDILQQCGAAYQELARAADGHVADIRLMQTAWPK